METQSQSNSAVVCAVISWPLILLPGILSDLVGEVQEFAPGVQFGMLTPGLKSIGPAHEAHLLFAWGAYLPGNEDEPGQVPVYHHTDGVWHWDIKHLPRRFSFLLGHIRELFPGIGFDSIAVVTFRGQLGFRNVLPQEHK